MDICKNSQNNLEEWRKFISIVENNPTARLITLESWRRCEKSGLTPRNLKFEFLSDEELDKKLNSNSQLIEVAKPYLNSISISLTEIPHIIALSDSDGWIIDYRNTLKELGGKAVGLCFGANWAEKNIGNNGIGTALAIEKPILVYGVEHFGLAYGDYASMGVPIWYNGKIIGALDISVPVKYAHPSRMYIAMACVTSIEATISHMNKVPEAVSEKVSSNESLTAASELIATAVHDLKNPLAVIRGLGQLGNLITEKPKVQNYFNRIIRQVDEMHDMVTDLLSIFRPEELMPHRIVPIIKEILQSFEPICDSKNIKLCLVSNADKYVNMSRNLFKRAIENIVNNAIQMMDDDGVMEITTKLDGNSILISIRDSAKGIPDELKETLFDAFSFRRSGGTGLGLFMAHYTITTTLKGEIWFDSKSGEGTTFFIKLPITQNTENSTLKQHRPI